MLMSNTEQQPSIEAINSQSVNLSDPTRPNKFCLQCNKEFDSEDNLKSHMQTCSKVNPDSNSSLASDSDLGMSNDSPKQSSSEATNNSRNESNSDSSNKSLNNNKERNISPMESAESADESDNSEFITSPATKKRKRDEEDASDRSRAYKLRKKSMSMKEGLFSLLNQTHPDVDFTGDPIISWLPDGKSFVIHSWDRFVTTMNRICGQTFKALASNLSKFGFVRQKNKEQNLLQRYYLCPLGFERGGSNVDLKKITSKNKLGSSLPYTLDTVPIPPGAFNPAILAHPLVYKVQQSPPMLPQAHMDVNGHSNIKDLQASNSNLPPHSVHVKQQPFVPAQAAFVPVNTNTNLLANSLNGNNHNSNNSPQTSREEPWPKLISLELKPTRVFTGPFDKRDENFRVNVHTLLTKKSAPACPEVSFAPLIQENCGDLYLTRLRGVPPDGLDWPTTPHTRVIYRTSNGRLQVGGSNQALQEGNVAVMRRHVWKSLCNRFKRHEYVLIDGQQKNKYWNVKEDSPVLYCYFRVTDEEVTVSPVNHVPVNTKYERPTAMSPVMNDHDSDMQYRGDITSMTNSYRTPNGAQYDVKMTDLDSIVEASVKMSASHPNGTAPRRAEVSHLPNGVVHVPSMPNGAMHAMPNGAMSNGYGHPNGPVPPQNSFVQSPAAPGNTFTLPYPGSKDPLPIGHPQMNMLGPSEVSNLLVTLENLKQQIKAMEVIKENQRLTYEKQVFDLTIENQSLKKQLDNFTSKFNQMRDGFNSPMVDGLMPPRGFNPAILAALQQTASMGHPGGIGATNSPVQSRATNNSN